MDMKQYQRRPETQQHYLSGLYRAFPDAARTFETEMQHFQDLVAKKCETLRQRRDGGGTSGA